MLADDERRHEFDEIEAITRDDIFVQQQARYACLTVRNREDDRVEACTGYLVSVGYERGIDGKAQPIRTFASTYLA